MSESGHSQPGMYGQGRKRRRRRDRDVGPLGQNQNLEYVPRERRVGSEELPGPLLQKTPIILAKRPGERSKPSQSVPISGGQALEKPIMLIKTREDRGKPGTPPEVASPASGSGASKLEREGQRPTQPVYQIQNRVMGAAVNPVIGQTKLVPPEKMKHSIKLVNDQMNWCDSAVEQRTFTGIDFYITQESVIFLDTQPILSPSILDHLINNDRKLPPEYNLPHTYVEMQSLQITAFLFTVCHVVIVIQDWFTDINLYRFLQTAEMLKPSTSSANHNSTGSSGTKEGSEYYPHIVFLQNKSSRDEFCPRNLKKMHMAVDKLMHVLIMFWFLYAGPVSMLDCNIFPGLDRDYLETEVNMFLLSLMENEGEDALTKAGSGAAPLFSLLPGYRGHPTFFSQVSKLHSQIMAMFRCQLSHTILTEKNWFHYAARIWDGVKKSSALSEYSRLQA
uniref:SMG9 nonsense mediated mRNA decay factor n=1 Tax=Hucho hucho TaxID=62062 RepID=A0A4W5M9B1_9TELE